MGDGFGTDLRPHYPRFDVAGLERNGSSGDHTEVGVGSVTIKDNLWQEGPIAYVEEIVVHEDQRGKGIGAQLLERLVLSAREAGCRRVELDSAFHRKEAHRFYERHGFENRAYLFSKAL